MPWTGEAPGYGFSTAKPWEPMAEDVATTNVAAQTDDPASLLSHYRTLIGLRAAHPALGVAGSLTSVQASVKGVYAVLRHDPVSGESAVVISNLTDEPVPDVRLSLANGPLCGTPFLGLALGSPTVDLASPRVTATGGFDGWSVGDMGPHGDLLVTLDP